jgi:hypothetical protein
MKVATPEVALARSLIIEEIQPIKKQLISCLESGERDFGRMRNLLERYADYLTAADALGHTCSIEDRA